MNIDSPDLRALATDLAGISARTHRATRSAYREGAERLAAEWRANAESTSGDAAVHYPKSITFDEKVSTNLLFEIGPESNKKQGPLGLVLEYGSPTSPPHLDGNRAADKLAPVISVMVLQATRDLI